LSDALRLRVLTATEVLLEDEELRWVKAQLADGAPIGIYPGHAPLLAEVVPSLLRYADRQGEHTREVRRGVLYVREDQVTVFTEHLPEPETALEADEEAAATERRFDRLVRELWEMLELEPTGE